MKKITIEEAARNYANIIHNRPLDAEERYYRDYQKYDAFIDGAKWANSQIEKKSYTQIELKQFAWECVANFVSNDENKVEIALVDVIIDRNNKQFEIFKNK